MLRWILALWLITPNVGHAHFSIHKKACAFVLSLTHKKNSLPQFETEEFIRSTLSFSQLEQLPHIDITEVREMQTIDKVSPKGERTLDGGRYQEIKKGQLNGKDVFIKVGPEKSENKTPFWMMTQLKWSIIVERLGFGPKTIGWTITEDGNYAIVQEWIDGQHISQVTEKLSIPIPTQTIATMISMSRELQRWGIGVYDLQVMVTKEGRPMIIDTEEWVLIDRLDSESLKEAWQGKTNEAFNDIIRIMTSSQP